MKTKTVTKAKKQSNPLDIIRPFLENPKNTEILIDGHQHFQVVTNGRLTDVPSPFKTEAQLMELIQAIAEPRPLTTLESLLKRFDVPAALVLGLLDQSNASV